MEVTEAIAWIHKQLPFGIKPGLTRINMILNELGNPQHQIKTIHVAGTNGKGSTTSFLSHILREDGYDVGTFTSPYIETFNERISLNHQPISDSDLVDLVERIKPLCEQIATTEVGHPTEFEIITAMAYLYFKEQAVDYAVIEVGLGGRLDSTNVINPILSIITSIGYDHIDILGNNLADIAYEKAGIIKSNTPIITGVSQHEAIQVIDQKAQTNHADVLKLGHDFHAEAKITEHLVDVFDFANNSISLKDLKIQLLGSHQINNASVAIEAYLQLLEVENRLLDPDIIRSGLKKTQWPGRFEVVRHNPDVILDGAHNVEAIQSLIDTINQKYDKNNVYILCSFLKTKPVDQIMSLFSEHFPQIYITTFDFKNNYEYYELNEKYENGNIIIKEDWKTAYDQLINQMKPSDALVITGSLYFVSEVKRTMF
ncbi:bifunctional folylpolyglutamate synthase/dihydrofolate synthase [Alkalibacillus almallahensis]|uniref:bifunctional folylpolyglutamate synthase/dihydrofolate synthase n=1 Tax=Alkalibacillus almallahensis TaxID=1379154 RepID=UPI0014213B8D|nr:folylpolyglutamate synthase/dihydrofolate synthase family protein [Alkalibacillus almallahensis]NIK11234.1 dihydrofolate synthase/folylpolyglutamate synthase [Alkalibacillus almallahensis]